VLQRSSADPSAVPGQSPRASTWLHRSVGGLSDESGMALIMAIVIIMVLTILVTSALAYTSSNSRNANYSSGGQKAYSSAEAGLNNAMAAVEAAGSDTTKMPVCPTTTVTTLASGATATWCGTYNSATKVWTIKSVGSVPNPTGPHAGPITRTLTQQANLTPPPFNFVALDTGCDVHTLIVDSSGQLNVTNAMYINSCNGVTQGVKPDAFDIFGSGGNISAPSIQVVGGWETDGGNFPNTDTVTINGTQCSLAKGNNPVSSAQPASCPQTGQPVLGDPLAGKVSPPALSSPACTSTTYGTAANYSPSQSLSASMATTTGTTLTSSGTAIQTSDVIQIGSEQMLVTAGGGTRNITVQRGYNNTTAATHTSGTSIKKVPVTTLGTAANPVECTIATGTVTLQPGTYYGGICIGGLTGSACGSNIGGSCHAGWTTIAYSPAVQLNTASLSATATSIPVDWSGARTADPVSTGDVIMIDNEQMTVTSAPATNGSATLTVTRHSNGTTATTHSNNAAVTQVQPMGTAHVTLAPGTYIMAGGGLFVCGLSTLSAPNVLIYNTQDPTTHASGTVGALDQVMINTTGSVSLGPQTSGAYEGLTYYQDPNVALDPGVTCEARTYFGLNPNPDAPTQTQINEYDLALMSMASTGANGALGSVSGSFYAPANTATFADAVSGTANLAVLTSCILIDGGNSTFAFQPTGLFGGNWILGPQSG
jgi:hypothetical protein